MKDALAYANMIDGRDWFLIHYSCDSLVKLKVGFYNAYVCTVPTLGLYIDICVILCVIISY